MTRGQIMAQRDPVKTAKQRAVATYKRRCRGSGDLDNHWYTETTANARAWLIRQERINISPQGWRAAVLRQRHGTGINL